MQTFQRAVRPLLELVKDLNGRYDPVTQRFVAEGDDVTAGWGSWGHTQSWSTTGTPANDCTPLYDDDWNWAPWT